MRVFLFFFLAGGVDEGRESHLVSWENISRPLESGLLGFGNLKHWNETFWPSGCGVPLGNQRLRSMESP